MSIKTDFDTANSRRAGHLSKARECAALSIPDVLPMSGSQGANDANPGVFSSMGPTGTRNLTGKLLLALYPPAFPWFGFRPGARLQSELSPELLARMESYLYARELLVRLKMDRTGFRAKMRRMLEHLLVAGDALAHLTRTYALQVHRLDQWVCQRGVDGKPLWVIYREKAAEEELSDEVLSVAGLKREDIRKSQDQRVEMYTRIRRTPEGQWETTQELNEKDIPGSRSVEPVCPFVSPGYVEIEGEDYSRSFIEEVIGDLRASNGLWFQLTVGAAIAAKDHPVIDPTSGLKARDLQQPSGTVLYGRVTADGRVAGLAHTRVDKNADFTFVLASVQAIDARLDKAMLVISGSQRDAERVTAQEVMQVSGELEGALAGVYSEIAEELQRPFLTRFVYQMEADGLLPPLPPAIRDAVDVEIVTGMAALSRQINVQALQAAVESIARLPGGLRRVDIDRMALDILRAYNLDDRVYAKSDEELAAEQEAEDNRQLRAAAGQQTVQSAGKIAETAAAQNAA